MKKTKSPKNPMTLLIQLLKKTDIASLAYVVEDRLEDYVQWAQPYEGEGGYAEGTGERLSQAVEFLNRLEEIKSLLQTAGTVPQLEDGFFAVIRWHEDDIKQALANRGYLANKSNVKRVLNSRAGRTLVDLSIEEGWAILEDCLDFVDGLEQRKRRSS
ncbi:hypothetical protein [Brevibacillus brevis]|uniref:Uncharacterized protein n=1 Tax=Brevibacillus brevis TaxID=1393 RepID=A0ABY9TCU4_BREBE|nr:hypothetical protein [Brevibacillus brevis]WNC17935.1 hypothetical protein RGB73_30230 [Brevibacillus brevis]